MKKTVVFGVVLSKTNTSPPFSDADDVDESISSLESEFTMPRTSKTTGDRVFACAQTRQEQARESAELLHEKSFLEMFWSSLP